MEYSYSVGIYSVGCICFWNQSDDRRATCDISGSLPIPPVHAIKTRKIRHQDLGNMQFNRTLRTENECVQRREIGEPRETNLGSKVVLKLSEPFQKSGRNITSDNFFTNLELGRKLLMQNFTIVATIRKNRKKLPAEFVSTKDRKEFTTLYDFQKKAMIASYCPKKEKMVTLLSTMH